MIFSYSKFPLNVSKFPTMKKKNKKYQSQSRMFCLRKNLEEEKNKRIIELLIT